jgi:hypothetical protein
LRKSVSNRRDLRKQDVASELRRMAREYQYRAATLDDGKLPDIGED